MGGAVGSKFLGAALTRDALVARAFERLGKSNQPPPMYPSVPAQPPIRGLLGPGPGAPPPMIGGLPSTGGGPVSGPHGGIPLGPGEGVSGGSALRYEAAQPIGDYRVLEHKDPETGRISYTTRPSQYASDIDAPKHSGQHVQMSELEKYALYWIKDEMETFPFEARKWRETQGERFNPNQRNPGAGLELARPGSAGAKIYREIVGSQGREVISAGREDVMAALDNLFQGKLTKTGEHVLEVARELANANENRAKEMMQTPGPNVDAFFKYLSQLEGKK